MRRKDLLHTTRGYTCLLSHCMLQKRYEAETWKQVQFILPAGNIDSG